MAEPPDSLEQLLLTCRQEMAAASQYVAATPVNIGNMTSSAEGGAAQGPSPFGDVTLAQTDESLTAERGFEACADRKSTAESRANGDAAGRIAAGPGGKQEDMVLPGSTPFAAHSEALRQAVRQLDVAAGSRRECADGITPAVPIALRRLAGLGIGHPTWH